MNRTNNTGNNLIRGQRDPTLRPIHPLALNTAAPWSQEATDALFNTMYGAAYQSMQAGTHAQYLRATHLYVSFCHRIEMRPFPMNRVTAAAFATYYVTVLNNRETNLPSVFSGIKFYHRLLGFPWPDAEELHLATCVRRGLQNACPLLRTPKFPITIARLRAVQGRFDLRNTDDLRVWSLLTLGHGACLRIGELMGLTYRDVAFTQAQDLRLPAPPVPSFKVTLTIRRSKMNKRGPDESVEIMPNGPLSAPYALRLYWLRTEDDREFNPGAKLFPIARSSLTGLLRDIFPTDAPHSGYSFRAGCTTDMWNAGLNPDFIRSFGRWSSEAYRCYAQVDTTRVSTEVALAHQASLSFYSTLP
jgi:integrase